MAICNRSNAGNCLPIQFTTSCLNLHGFSSGFKHRKLITFQSKNKVVGVLKILCIEQSAKTLTNLVSNLIILLSSKIAQFLEHLALK